MPERREYPDAHHKVLRAFERRWEKSGRVPFETAAVVGKGPFRRGKMQSYLWDLGVETRYLKDIGEPEVLVLGRTWIEGQEKRQTKQLLSRRRGETLRICSQEMLLAWSMTGVDPNERPPNGEDLRRGPSCPGDGPGRTGRPVAWDRPDPQRRGRQLRARANRKPTDSDRLQGRSYQRKAEGEAATIAP